MAKGQRGRAKRALSRACGNLDHCLNHLIEVRLMSSESDHKDISDYLDQLGEATMALKHNIDSLERRL